MNKMEKIVLILTAFNHHVVHSQFRHLQHVGCFKDSETERDLPTRVRTSKKPLSIDDCISECARRYFMYAGLQDGSMCFCGSSYGRHGASTACNIPCADNKNEFCGGKLASIVYKTGITIPGPPRNLALLKSKMEQLTVTWKAPDGAPEKDFITGYEVTATINKTFDTSSGKFIPKQLQYSGSTRSATILGLLPGVRYNISVRARSSSSQSGPITSGLFWTEIGNPEIPETPVLIQHDDDDVKPGEIHVKVTPLTRERNGPITAYRIVVIDETDPVPFYPNSLTDWNTAQETGLKYWICAEVGSRYFDYHDEFIVGDRKYYGPYYNYGPLPMHNPERDYHVTVGAVSTLNNVTKVSYARVSHDQHSDENIVVFKFHEDDDHEGHDHGNYYVIRDNFDEDDDDSSGLAVALIIAIIIFGFLLASIVGIYIYLRVFFPRKGSSRGDVQELTARNPSVDLESEASYNPYNYSSQDEIDSPVSSASQMEAIRRQVWAVPKNFLDLSHEVIGRGKYGSIVKGTVNKRGIQVQTNVQVIPGKILEDEERKFLSRDLETVVRYGTHPNLIQLIGLCEDVDTMFVVLEDWGTNLKQILLDSRTLIHYPVYAEKNKRFTTIREEVLMDVLIGIVRGMDHLNKNRLFHKKLCARNVYLSNDNIPKISGVGITEFVKPGVDVDYVRWSAQETFKTKQYISKCDVWSFGILMWEAVTIGGTPYPDVKSKDVPSRVQRGMRVPQTKYMSDELYQLMLQCWQLDVDERPTFEELSRILTEMSEEGQLHINFSLTPGFQYETYSQDLEISLKSSGGSYV